jgi:3-hydroxypropanoate dehydrogenase
MKPQIDAKSLAQLFDDAHTFSTFEARTVEEQTLRRLVELARLGPTSANGQPMRIVFVKSPEGKARLLECVSAGNVAKVQSAPVTAIVATDLNFASNMGRVFPQAPEMATSLAAMPDAARDAWLLQNGSLQGGYLILAARALGLDCGPMGGFDKAKVNDAFFKASTWRANFLLNLGYGDPSGAHPRNPRLLFEEMCSFA